jgi:CRP-like cAMP-binding protein
MLFEGANGHGQSSATAVARRIFEAFVIGELHTHCMRRCALHVHVHCMCTACAPHVHRMYPTCTARTGALGGTQLFDACSEEALHGLAPLFSLEERATAGATIYTVGDEPDACYLLLQGSVRLLHGAPLCDKELATLHSHDAMRPQHAHTFFGEHALVGASMPHKTMAITAGPCKLLVLHRWGYAAFLHLVPDANEMLRQTAAMRTDHAAEQAASLRIQKLSRGRSARRAKPDASARL